MRILSDHDVDAIPGDAWRLTGIEETVSSRLPLQVDKVFRADSDREDTSLAAFKTRLQEHLKVGKLTEEGEADGTFWVFESISARLEIRVVD